jgi:hypothetical protein
MRRDNAAGWRLRRSILRGSGSAQPLSPFVLRTEAEDMMPELRISTDKVEDFIEAARELAGKIASTAGDGTTTGDDSKLVSIEEYAGDDDRRGQAVEFIAGLNVAEQVDLLALIYIGRGDYDIADWDDALREARDRIEARDPDYMIGDAALPEYLGSALDAFEQAAANGA